MSPRLMNWLLNVGALSGLSSRITLSRSVAPLVHPELTRNVPVLPGVFPYIPAGRSVNACDPGPAAVEGSVSVELSAPPVYQGLLGMIQRRDPANVPPAPKPNMFPVT